MATVSSEEIAESGVDTLGVAGAVAASSSAPAPGNVVARVADFAELVANGEGSEVQALESLLEVRVTVKAELGRATLPIGEVLKLGPGSVLELNRSISEPVDLFVQGVRLARGEVVVVDDRFAIRIKDLVEPRKKP
jgi:flagellar motor switch protein FliN/FliY